MSGDRARENWHDEDIQIIHVVCSKQDIISQKMRQTWNMKRRMNMFLPHLKDENTNRGAAYEPKITRDLHSVSMMIWASVTHLLRALMIKSNGQSNSNNIAVYFKSSHS